MGGNTSGQTAPFLSHLLICDTDVHLRATLPFVPAPTINSDSSVLRQSFVNTLPPVPWDPKQGLVSLRSHRWIGVNTPWTSSGSTRSTSGAVERVARDDRGKTPSMHSLESPVYSTSSSGALFYTWVETPSGPKKGKRRRQGPTRLLDTSPSDLGYWNRGDPPRRSMSDLWVPEVRKGCDPPPSGRTGNGPCRYRPAGPMSPPTPRLDGPPDPS